MARHWKTLVAEGKRLTQTYENSQWAWADLALEVEPLVTDPALCRLAGTSGRLERWIQEVEAPYTVKTLSGLRGVAHAWPAAERVDASFYVHKLLASPEHRKMIYAGMKVAEVQKLLGHTTTKEWRANTYKVSIDRLAGALLDPDTTAALFEKHPEVKEHLTSLLFDSAVEEILQADFVDASLVPTRRRFLSRALTRI